MPSLPAGVAWLALWFGIGLAGTLAARRYALSRDLLDHPGERRSHAVATPRGGGIGIVAAVLVAMAAAALLGRAQPLSMALAGVGLALVAGIGWIDDHRPLTPWSRLAVHAVAASLLALVAYRESGLVPVAAMAFVLAMALANVWNFMDGIDGIAALQALVVGCAFASLAPGGAAAWLGLAVAAACAGFLPLNLVRARIFLGDVGSGALGYSLALVMVLAAAESTPDSAATWVLLLLPPAAFVVDTSLTLASRIVRGEQWWTAHVGHGYQRWARRLGRHWPVTAAYAAWAVAGSAIAASLGGRPLAFIMGGGIAWYLGGGIAWLWLRSLHVGKDSQGRHSG